MTISVGFAAPPHREGAVAQFRVYEGEVIYVAAEMFVEDGRTTIAMYPRAGGQPWEFTLADFAEAIGKGLEILKR